eukprot:scaffold870_cov268-Pinguiococcus_pyrenoidosus.AAC.29
MGIRRSRMTNRASAQEPKRPRSGRLLILKASSIPSGFVLGMCLTDLAASLRSASSAASRILDGPHGMFVGADKFADKFAGSGSQAVLRRKVLSSLSPPPACAIGDTGGGAALP